MKTAFLGLRDAFYFHADTGWLTTLGKGAIHTSLCWQIDDCVWQTELASQEKGFDANHIKDWSEISGVGDGYLIRLKHSRTSKEHPVHILPGSLTTEINCEGIDRLETLARGYASIRNGNLTGPENCDKRDWYSEPQGYGGPMLDVATSNTYISWMLSKACECLPPSPKGARGWDHHPWFPGPVKADKSLDPIANARDFAREKHAGQKRKYSGVPYFSHPERVAFKIRSWGLGPEAIAAGYLHDVIEDCGVTRNEIELKFGKAIAQLVDGMTNKTHGLTSYSRAERKKMDRDRLAKESALIKVIKAIDRIDNLNEMVGADDSFKRKYAEESLSLALILPCPGDALENICDMLITEIVSLAVMLKPS